MIYFARMWGIMETLEPIRQLEQEQLKLLLLGWAKEFMVAKGMDEVDFFVKKTKEWKEVSQNYDIL